MTELPFSSLDDDDFRASRTTPSAAAPKTSGFLDLPGELRNHIYALALGGQEIHINVKPVHEEERKAFVSTDRLPKAQRYGRTLYQRCRLPPPQSHTPCDWIRFRRTVCECAHDFTKEYSDVKRAESGEQTPTKKPFTTYSTKHASCSEKFQGRHHSHSRQMRLNKSPKLPLNLLATCKKVYAEAAFVPFAHNTFSFASIQDFQDFILLALQKSQAELLTSVHIFSASECHSSTSPLWLPLKQETLDLVTALKEMRLTVEFQARVWMVPVEGRAKPKQRGLSVKVLFEYGDQATAEAHTWAPRLRRDLEEILGKGADALEYGWVRSSRMHGHGG